MLGKSVKKTGKPATSISVAKMNAIIKASESISQFKDLDAILDNILTEARKLSNAEAGSIFLVEKNKLVFSYVQNEKLFKNDEKNNKFLYQNHSISIDDTSIAGYVAKYGVTLHLDDVHELPSDAPYKYNRSFDEKTGYRTMSMLAIPIRDAGNVVEGVMEVINAKDEKGEYIPFTEADRLLLEYFVKVAVAFALKTGKHTREMIMRMIEMSKLRDPRETGNHVQRVSAYSIEIYENWARKNNIPMERIKRTRDSLRISSMMHDVGKVAISDAILKKPGKLDDAEFEIMKSHTVLGARLFVKRGDMEDEDSFSQLDILSANVILNHHEKWDGTGYPGKVESIHSEPVRFGAGKKGKEIHWSGRIVALADVYDALIMRRVYKAPWPEEEVQKYIRDQAGKQFDPDMVESFFEIYETIKAIRTRFADVDNEHSA